MSFEEDGTLVPTLLNTLCGENLFANSVMWAALTTGWLFFVLSSAALVRIKRKAIRIKHLNSKMVPCTASNALYLFKQPHFEKVIPPLESNTAVFELMWTEANQDKTVWKQVFGAMSMFMGGGRVMIIVNDGNEPTVFIKTPLFIDNMEQFVTSHKHLFTHAPKKLTLVLLGSEEISQRADQLEQDEGDEGDEEE